MSSSRRQSSSSASAIKYKWIPLEAGDEHRSRKESILREGTGASYGRSLLTTAELASAIGAVWRVLGHRPAGCGSRDVGLRQGDKGLRGVGVAGNRTPNSARLNYERLREIKKLLLFDSLYGSGFAGSLVHRNAASARYGGRNCLNTAGCLDDFAVLRESLNERYFASLRNVVNVTSRSEDGGKTVNCVSEGSTFSSDSLAIEDGRSDVVNSSEPAGSSGKSSFDFVESAELPPTSGCPACSVASATDKTSQIAISSTPGIYASHYIEVLPSTNCKSVGYQEPPDIETLGGQSISKDSTHVNSNTSTTDPAINFEFLSNQSLSMQDKLSLAFGKKKHAFAGALAGTFASICLHPFDTVKTVIQACSVNRMTNFQTFQLIVSERGFMGLYRGIASSIATSAPTSAIYTFTYETLKAAMLPILPKDYHSLAHCTAGGCASVATSVIFTPSERIKQQMQVHSYYRNCWSALIGILQKGGFPSLYAGWGAVLCRNIPHSVIKFYTYERLKKLLLPLSQPTSRLGTLETLFCGGCAGSTAALFTTPFDVVKTRLQTQVPGSLAKYNGVFHALQHIAEHEGLRGLYRGLIPRLVMYVSQGAIFFASYEFFKTVFSLDMPDSDPQVMDK